MPTVGGKARREKYEIYHTEWPYSRLMCNLRTDHPAHHNHTIFVSHHTVMVELCLGIFKILLGLSSWGDPFKLSDDDRGSWDDCPQGILLMMRIWLVLIQSTSWRQLYHTLKGSRKKVETIDLDWCWYLFLSEGTGLDPAGVTFWLSIYHFWHWTQRKNPSFDMMRLHLSGYYELLEVLAVRDNESRNSSKVWEGNCWAGKTSVIVAIPSEPLQ